MPPRLPLLFQLGAWLHQNSEDRKDGVMSTYIHEAWLEGLCATCVQLFGVAVELCEGKNLRISSVIASHCIYMPGTRNSSVDDSSQAEGMRMKLLQNLELETLRELFRRDTFRRCAEINALTRRCSQQEPRKSCLRRELFWR